MKKIKLPKAPTNLPANVAVEDFDHEDGKFSRVVMEAVTEQSGGDSHLVVYAQAYEMTADGDFVAAPLGYPSRTRRTPHTVSLSALGVAVDMKDAWVVSSQPYNPVLPDPDVTTTNNKPVAAGTHHGQRKWAKSEQRLYEWREGLVSVVTRTKTDEMVNVLATSGVRSGLAFR